VKFILFVKMNNKIFFSVITSILITGLLFTGTFEQNAYAINSWTTQTSGTILNLNSVDFIDVNNGYAVGVNGIILKTTNGGLTWTTSPSGTILNLNSVDFIDVNNGIIVGDSGTILKTLDGGLTWTPSPAVTGDNLVSVDFVDANTAFAVGFTGTILKTLDGGLTWTPSPSGTSSLQSVDFIDVNNGIIVGPGGTTLHTTNGGLTWTTQTSGTINPLLSVDFVDANTAFAVGFHGTILKFSPNTSCWSANPNLAVSTENTATSNVFGGPMVTKVTICDSDISGTTQAKGEPDVTVNGKILRMAQDTTGLWHGYFADRTQAQLADQSATSSPPGVDLDLGYFCSNQSTIPISSSAFSDTKGIVLPVNTTISGSQGIAPFPMCSGVPTSPNHNNVINGIDALNPGNTLPFSTGIGQIGITNIQFWPFIQLYDFVETGNVVVQYNKGGGVQSSTLTFDSSDPSIDSDGDGIADVVDIVSTNPSFAFSDIPQFTTFGSILTSGDQTLTILDVPNANGVKISTSSHGGPIPATVTDCNGTIYTLTAGDVLVLACASSDGKVLEGIVEVEYFVDGVSFGTTILTAGDDVTFEQDTLTFTNNGSAPVVILVNGEQITIDGGETVTLPGDVTLCHKDKKTITISSEDVDDHLRHGDKLGACEDEEHEDKKGNGHDKHEDKENGKGHEKFDNDEDN